MLEVPRDSWLYTEEDSCEIPLAIQNRLRRRLYRRQNKSRAQEADSRQTHAGPCLHFNDSKMRTVNLVERIEFRCFDEITTLQPLATARISIDNASDKAARSEPASPAPPSRAVTPLAINIRIGFLYFARIQFHNSRSTEKLHGVVVVANQMDGGVELTLLCDDVFTLGGHRAFGHDYASVLVLYRSRRIHLRFTIIITHNIMSDLRSRSRSIDRRKRVWMGTKWIARVMEGLLPLHLISRIQGEQFNYGSTINPRRGADIDNSSDSFFTGMYVVYDA
ncbi:hypothetical protein EVAR_68486_1 [Eumeta japonica]|uniref:Uncharacterized protein n=1 Tax=Eumeta variegata TaxID=151549 RepID=A0A4C2A949_EUMVA|nr:hypothetical protein EVAR_68486_1 [Eumeta japonica]